MTAFPACKYTSLLGRIAPLFSNHTLLFSNHTSLVDNYPQFVDAIAPLLDNSLQFVDAIASLLYKRVALFDNSITSLDEVAQKLDEIAGSYLAQLPACLNIRASLRAIATRPDSSMCLRDEPFAMLSVKRSERRAIVCPTLTETLTIPNPKSPIQNPP
jgi:hypothetical protein